MAITVILLIIIALFFLRFRVPAMGAATGRATPAQAAQATAAALPKVLLTASPTVPPIAPPEVALPEGGLQIGQNELDGSAPGAGQVQIAIDGEVIGTVAVGPDGAWSLPFVLDQPGTYTLEIRALDGQGQVAASSTAPLYVEKPPVALQARAPSWGEWAPVDDSRSTARLELSGEGEPGIEIEVLDNDAVAGSTTVRDDGTWRFEYEIGAGEHALVVRVSGVASASGAPETRPGRARRADLRVRRTVQGEPMPARPARRAGQWRHVCGRLVRDVGPDRPAHRGERGRDPGAQPRDL